MTQLVPTLTMRTLAQATVEASGLDVGARIENAQAFTCSKAPRFAPPESGSAVQQHRAPRVSANTAFRASFIVVLLALPVAVLALRIEGIVPQCVVLATFFLSPVFAGLCGAGAAWLAERRLDQLQRRALEESRRLQQETSLRLLLLQAQLEPHFLFNTLASLRALLREDIDQAEGLVDALVSHLRAVVPTIRREIGDSTLADQLAICTSYLDLMSIRLDGRLSYQVDMPDSLKCALVPPLMLLTLVENAIKHGIEPKMGHGRITIEVRPIAALGRERIAVTVTDDGVGLTEQPHQGLGLNNLREQLALRYGSEAALRLESAAIGGTVASLLIPYTQLQAT